MRPGADRLRYRRSGSGSVSRADRRVRPSAVSADEAAIRHSVTISAPPERAFILFTEELASWWPREYTWGGEALERIEVEPREGGACFEVGPHGFRCDWGRVLASEPPRRLVFSWQIAPDRTPQPDPAKASEVEIRFEPAGAGGTRVELEHRGFSRHGDEGDRYRAGLGSAEGWPYMLGRLAAAADT